MHFDGSSARTAVMLLMIAFTLVPVDASAESFLRYPGTARMVLVENETDQCLYADRNEVVLRECASMRDRNQIWQIRKDFTIYNEGRDRCIDASDPEQLRLAPCDFADRNQQWWMVKTTSDERWEIEQLRDMSQCVSTVGDGSEEEA
ncbi:MAG: RICIN domain-containing protein, partial [Myxococcota bacterium]